MLLKSVVAYQFHQAVHQPNQYEANKMKVASMRKQNRCLKIKKQILSAFVAIELPNYWKKDSIKATLRQSAYAGLLSANPTLRTDGSQEIWQKQNAFLATSALLLVI